MQLSSDQVDINRYFGINHKQFGPGGFRDSKGNRYKFLTSSGDSTLIFIYHLKNKRDPIEYNDFVQFNKVTFYVIESKPNAGVPHGNSHKPSTVCGMAVLEVHGSWAEYGYINLEDFMKKAKKDQLKPFNLPEGFI